MQSCAARISAARPASKQSRVLRKALSIRQVQGGLQLVDASPQSWIGSSLEQELNSLAILLENRDVQHRIVVVTALIRVGAEREK